MESSKQEMELFLPLLAVYNLTQLVSSSVALPAQLVLYIVTGKSNTRRFYKTTYNVHISENLY